MLRVPKIQPLVTGSLWRVKVVIVEEGAGVFVPDFDGSWNDSINIFMLAITADIDNILFLTL